MPPVFIMPSTDQLPEIYSRFIIPDSSSEEWQIMESQYGIIARQR